MGWCTREHSEKQGRLELGRRDGKDALHEIWSCKSSNTGVSFTITRLCQLVDELCWTNVFAIINFYPHGPIDNSSAHLYSGTVVMGEESLPAGLPDSSKALAILGRLMTLRSSRSSNIRSSLTGFSRHASSRLSSSGTTLSAATEANHIHRGYDRYPTPICKAGDAQALVSQRSRQSSSDDGSGLSDSDPEPSSDDNRYSSENKQARPSIRNYSV